MGAKKDWELPSQLQIDSFFAGYDAAEKEVVCLLKTYKVGSVQFNVLAKALAAIASNRVTPSSWWVGMDAAIEKANRAFKRAVRAVYKPAKSRSRCARSPRSPGR